MTAFNYIALIGWIPLSIALFLVLPPRRAVLASIVGGYLLLPLNGFRLPVIPDYSKYTAVVIGPLLGILLFDCNRLAKWRPTWYDVPLLLWCFGAPVSLLVNNLGVNAACSALFLRIQLYLLPYFFGRIYFTDRAALRDLAGGLMLGGLLYIPLCWFELRMSPVLNTWVYGYMQHTFMLSVRGDGYRPMVFLDNGIVVAAILSGQSILAFWLWRGRALKSVCGVPMALITGCLVLTTLLTKTAGGIITMLTGIGMFYAVRAPGGRLALVCLILFPAVYTTTRTAGLLPQEPILQLVRTAINDQRAASLQYRMNMEVRFVDHAMQRPILGWGGHGRNFVANESGQSVGALDSFWIGALTTYGIAGLASIFLFMLVPPVQLARRFSTRLLTCPELIPATAAAVTLATYAVHQLSDSITYPGYFVAYGALASFIQASATDISTPASRTLTPTKSVPTARRVSRKLVTGAGGAYR